MLSIDPHVTDIKMLGTALGGAGLLNKPLAAMTENEVRTLAMYCVTYSRPRCITCCHWTKNDGQPWWIGTCALNNKAIDHKTLCHCAIDTPPF